MAMAPTPCWALSSWGWYRQLKGQRAAAYGSLQCRCAFTPACRCAVSSAKSSSPSAPDPAVSSLCRRHLPFVCRRWNSVCTSDPRLCSELRLEFAKFGGGGLRPVSLAHASSLAAWFTGKSGAAADHQLA